METYQKSVQDVDAALKRLNATLESYKLSATKPTTVPQAIHSRRTPTTGINGNQASANCAKSVPGAPANVSASLREEHADEIAQDIVWKDVLALRSTQELHEITKDEYQPTVDAVSRILDQYLPGAPHCIPLHIVLSQKFLQLGYPDLAAGAAYKALLLCDAAQDTSDEYHDFAASQLREVIQQIPLVERIRLLKGELHNESHGRLREAEEDMDVEVDVWVRKHYLPLTYRALSHSLLLCGCLRSAGKYVDHGQQSYPDDAKLASIAAGIRVQVARHDGQGVVDDNEISELPNPNEWPDQGLVRREVYPWNEWEPNRLEELPALNAMMTDVAPKLEVRAVELPALTTSGKDGEQDVVTQLGVFAKEDIVPGEVVLDETSMLTANNKLQDALCDACSADLPGLDDPAANNVRACPHCEVVFCSQKCHEAAEESYHVAVCGADLDGLLKDVSPAEAADSLYTLLLLRALALAETQGCHPLELREVKYIWGDFHDLPVSKQWQSPSIQEISGTLLATDANHAGFPRTLPFSFDYNIRLPLQMLEKMDIDIFAEPKFDFWVFNTLYAKFRGTASARLSGLGGRAIRGPEVSAVHPMWCLANHSCDPNVSWEWGGSIKFWSREQRVAWEGKEGKQVRSVAGIKKGEEVFNHYCDVDLPVKERREWARGALGGDCMCARCVWEAHQ